MRQVRRFPFENEGRKANARSVARIAASEGRIERQACRECGGKAEIHHADYSQPMLIDWLCRSCHLEHHKKEKAMTKPDGQKLDCFRLLAEMNKCGVNTAEVARRLGKAHSTVQKWKEGAEPCYTDGVRLLDLHSYVLSNHAKAFPQG